MTLHQPITPPEPYGYELAVMLAIGDHARANRTLAALNQIQRAFDVPDYIMPAPCEGPMEGLETCPADSWTVTVVDHGDDRWSAAA